MGTAQDNKKRYGFGYALAVLCLVAVAYLAGSKSTSASMLRADSGRCELWCNQSNFMNNKSACGGCGLTYAASLLGENSGADSGRCELWCNESNFMNNKSACGGCGLTYASSF